MVAFVPTSAELAPATGTNRVQPPSIGLADDEFISRAALLGQVEKALFCTSQTEARFAGVTFVSHLTKAVLRTGLYASPNTVPMAFAEQWPPGTVEWLYRQAAAQRAPTCTLLQEFMSPYSGRLYELRGHADEEGITPNPASRSEFLKFVDAADPPLREGALFLLNDGTYRAMWRDDHWRLSLRFRGDGSIDYVLLDRTDPPNGEADTVDLKGFRALYERRSLGSLLSE